MQTKFFHTRIKGLRTLVPPTIIDIDSELHSIYKGDQNALNRIKKVIGLQTRHITPPHITASDMAEQAANNLLDSLDIDRSSIGALIFVTQTPDYILPASACYLHGRLKLPTSCLSFDINQACAGYLYGLYVAHCLIDSGGVKRVLLLVGDTLSKFVNPLDSNLAPIMGDGVSATLLESTSLEDLENEKSTHSIHASESIPDSISKPTQQARAFFGLGSQGDKFYQLIIPEGAARVPTREIITDPKVWETSEVRALNQLYMDGAEIFNFAVLKYPETFEQILKFSGIGTDKLDYFFFHQANKYIVDNITRRLGLEKSKVPNTTTCKYGNLSGCSVPATICDTLSEQAKNGLQSPLMVHLAGFGAGLAWGNAILRLDPGFTCQEVGIYKPQEK